MAALALTFLMAAAACGDDAEGTDPVAASGHDLRTLRLSHTVALPTELPPGLESIQTATGDGLPLISFYSTNEPLVTVCTGAAERCRALTSPFATLQRRGGALVTIDRAEAPEDASAISAELRRFWSDIRLTTSAPTWLERSS